MKKEDKTKEQLITEIQQLNEQLTESARLGIMERMKEAMALQASEKKYRILLESLPHKIFHKDKNSVYVSCNNNYAKDLKISPDDIAGKTDYDFYPSRLAEKYRADDRRIMKLGKTEDIEEKYLIDGKEIIIHTIKTPIRNESGKVVGILGIFRDITEYKCMEKDLRLFRDLIDQLNDAIFISEPATSNILYVNDKACGLLGYSHDELINMRVIDFEIVLSNINLWKKHVKEVKKKRYLIINGKIRRKDGSDFAVEVNVKYVIYEKENYILALIRDISKQKK